MNETIEYKIFNRIKKAKRGVVFFAGDFVAYGNSNTCGKALERLTKDGKIMRVARGIYTIPRKSKYFGPVTPSLEAIAEAIARRDKARITPTGLFAENALGLSTQIPMKAIYLTDGAPRKIIIGDRTLLFKRTTPKNVAAWGKISGLAIQALKSIGKDSVTDNDIEKIVAALKQESKKNLANDIKLAPDWIRKIMRKAQPNNSI